MGKPARNLTLASDRMCMCLSSGSSKCVLCVSCIYSHPCFPGPRSHVTDYQPPLSEPETTENQRAQGASSPTSLGKQGSVGIGDAPGGRSSGQGVWA